MNETRHIVRFKRVDGATPDVEEYYLLDQSRCTNAPGYV